MKASTQIACCFALLSSVAVTANVERFSLGHWYTIEIVIFQQNPEQGVDNATAAESLIRELPTEFPAATYVFPFSEFERMRRFQHVASIDVDAGRDPCSLVSLNPIDLDGTSPRSGGIDPLAEELLPDTDANTTRSCLPQGPLTFAGTLQPMPDWLAGYALTPQATLKLALTFSIGGPTLARHLIEALNPTSDDSSSLESEAFHEGFEELEPDPLATATTQLNERLDDREEWLQQHRLEFDEHAKHMSAAASRLANAGRRVLFHGAFHHQVSERNDPQRMLIQSWIPWDDKYFLAEGSVTVYRDRYLVIEAELWLHDSRFAADDSAETPVIWMSARRQVMANQKHYFDHPHLGMIAEIRDVEVPENIRDLAAQVEELRQTAAIDN